MGKFTNKTDRCMYRQWDFDYNSYGEAVRVARVSIRMTQKDVAKQVGCGRTTIYKMEHGGYCDPRIMYRVCELLGVDLMTYNIVRTSEDDKKRYLI